MLRILLADVVDSADVGMIEGGGGLCLSTEAAERLRIARHFVRQELQSDETVQASVLGLVNYAHTATTELLDDAVVRDGLVDHKELRRLAGRFILRTRHLLVNGSRDSGWIVGKPSLSRLGKSSPSSGG
jgi:hypothetical protein